MDIWQEQSDCNILLWNIISICYEWWNERTAPVAITMLQDSRFIAAAANEWVWLTFDNVPANLLPGKEAQMSVG
jgi:hypothetical protein